MKKQLGMILLLLAFVAPLRAQEPHPEEKVIRDLIAASDTGKAIPSTTDRIFWSGPYRRPVIGSEKPEPIGTPAGGAPTDPNLGRVPGSQKLKTQVVRLEVAKSGEMAWEFSNAELSFDLTNGQHIVAPISILRTWRKDNGQWKTAAAFMRPHDQGMSAPGAGR